MPAPPRRSIPCGAFWWALILLTAPLGTARAVPPQGPELSNDAVICRWAAPDRGGGLLAMVPATQTGSLLDDAAPAPHWWRVKLRDGRTIANTELPCSVSKRPGVLVFTWTGDIRVTVNAHLDGVALRSRIAVDVIADGAGLREVVFPIVDGMRPLSKDAANDRLLHAFRTGHTAPTPLTTGKPVHMQYCIGYYMQFTALLGEEGGLYIGDHDPTAAWKDMHWTPNAETQTLAYDISHPVLDWGADEPVRRYVSPGPCVVAPFQGGVVGGTMDIAAHGLVALKLELIP